jgi:hypothetical protein
MLMAADAQPAGWAHLVGLLVALLIASLAVGAHQWWTDGRPSPTPPWSRTKALPPGETRDTGPDDTDFETADDTEFDTGEGRRIVTLPDGSRVVRYYSYAADDLDDPEGEFEEDETREEMADRLVASRCRYSDAVKEIMNSFDVSESTAKRAIGEAQRRAQRS